MSDYTRQIICDHCGVSITNIAKNDSDMVLRLNALVWCERCTHNKYFADIRRIGGKLNSNQYIWTEPSSIETVREIAKIYPTGIFFCDHCDLKIETPPNVIVNDGVTAWHASCYENMISYFEDLDIRHPKINSPVMAWSSPISYKKLAKIPKKWMINNIIRNAYNIASDQMISPILAQGPIPCKMKYYGIDCSCGKCPKTIYSQSKFIIDRNPFRY